MYNPDKTLSENLFTAIEEQSKLIKETNDLLRQQLAFWNTITEQDDFTEMVARDGITPR